MAKFILVIKKRNKKRENTGCFFYHPYGFEKELYMTIYTYISIHSARNTKKNAVVAHMIV